MSLSLFKKLLKRQEKKKEKILKPYGVVTIWEDKKEDSNIIMKEKNLIVDSYFNIIVGLFSGDTNKQISSLALGDGGVVNGILQSPSLSDTTLYSQVFQKDTIENISIESILDKYISYNFIIEKNESNGTGAQVISEIGLKSVDGTLFARKCFSEIVKTSEKILYIEWRLQW